MQHYQLKPGVLRCVLLDPASRVTLPLARLRRKLGINQFEEFTPDKEINKDYAEPFTGLKGMKELFAVYLMKLVPFMHSPDNVPVVVKRQSVSSILVETAGQCLIVIQRLLRQ